MKFLRLILDSYRIRRDKKHAIKELERQQPKGKKNSKEVVSLQTALWGNVLNPPSHP